MHSGKWLSALSLPVFFSDLSLPCCLFIAKQYIKNKMLLAYLYIAYWMHYCTFPLPVSWNLPHPLLREIFWLSGRSVCLFPTSGCAPGTRCDSRVRYLCSNPAMSTSVCYIPQCIRLCGFTAMLNEVTVPWSAQTLVRGSRCRSVTWCRV